MNTIICELSKLLFSHREKVEAHLGYKKKKSGRPAKLALWSILQSVLAQVILRSGTLGSVCELVGGVKIAESTISERRRKIATSSFLEATCMLLTVCAEEARDSFAFYRGLRLIGIDGSSFSVKNTTALLPKIAKSVSRRCEAAFGKLPLNCLVELGTHAPVGVTIGHTAPSSEWALGLSLLPQLPAKSLLLGDRLYGHGAFLRAFSDTCAPAGSELLVRVRKSSKVEVIQPLNDGSRLVRVKIRKSARHSIEWQGTVREIRAQMSKPGFRPQELRLWTTLLDDKEYPASELLSLYATRWQHELFFREMKHTLTKNGDLLDSQTLETACQEVAALFIAMSVVAKQRLAVREIQKKVLPSVSILGFEKALFVVKILWVQLEAAKDVLTELQKNQLIQKTVEMFLPQIVPKKRSRSSPRAVRQPVSGWPRKINQKSTSGDVEFAIL